MNHKILCIDDETHNLEALERLLRKKYHIEVAESGALALEKIRDHNFSLIISDQKMPNMTGVEFFMEAKKLQPEAIRVLLTGYTDLESVISAINQGQIYRYITKPWEPEEFLSIVAQAIEVFEMKQTIQDQNRQLTQANEKLMSLDKLKTDFMLLVNHELKTPLTGIFSFVQLLSEEKMTDEQSLYIQKIAKNTRRLQDLIDDTLLITKLQARQEDLSTESVGISTLLKQHITVIKKDFTNKNLEFKIEPENSFEQQANKKYLDVVLRKLVTNSYQHSKEKSAITYQLTENESHWSITTENELTAPLNKDINEILNAFSTSGNILNHSGGTGLGLSVIQAIVKLFNGKLSVAEEKQKFQLNIDFPKTQ